MSSHADGREQVIRQAASDYARVTADDANPDLFAPLTFLLAQVRKALGMDVAFVSRFVDGKRVFEVVSSQGECVAALQPGKLDPLMDTYCQRIVEGRLSTVIPDTTLNAQASALPITAALNIKAYLSAPVLLRDGTVFGTVCCISHAARSDLRESDAQALRAVADAVAASIDLRKGKIRYASWTTPKE